MIPGFFISLQKSVVIYSQPEERWLCYRFAGIKAVSGVMNSRREGLDIVKTVRQQIVELLQDQDGLGVRELSQQLHITEREIYPHLEHINRSVKTKGKKLLVDPARCLQCGFIFQDRKKLSPPGHCPKCKGTHLQRPVYSIR